MMKKKIAIQLSNISKKYALLHQKPTLIEQLLFRNKTEDFWALRDVSIKIKAGEKVGVTGPNGAGKTTLLQIIAGITTPTTGSVVTRGRVISLIDISGGLHPDLTGEENLLLNGMLIGMPKDEIKKKRDQIISFADIGKFLDAPIHTYSTGMKLRLGMSIALHSNPDILILDEGIAVGDANFQEKIRLKIKSIMVNKTVLLASHADYLLKQNCDRFIHIRNGKLTEIGSLKDFKKFVASHEG